MYCGRCGTQNDDNARFCSECGADLSPVNPAAVPVHPDQDQVLVLRSSPAQMSGTVTLRKEADLSLP